MKPVFETDRLALRQFVEADAAHLLILDGDPEVMRYVGPYALADEVAYRERIQNYFLPYYDKGPDFGFWVAEEKGSGRFIGWFHLRPALEYRFAREAGFRDGDFDIGYRLIREAWGMGYATEVTRTLIRRGFDRPAVHTIVACVLVGNPASCRVLEKCGLRRAAEFSLPGFEMPAAKYTITRNEFVAG
jgi:RimJ/RimL family protein N-acetyltransferase